MATNLSFDAKPSATFGFSFGQAPEHFLEVADSTDNHYHSNQSESQAS
jgi:hypothetical protein